MAKIVLSAFFFLGFVVPGFSQKIDSLENLLDRNEDTIKVNLLNDLSRLYFNQSKFNKSDSLAKKAKRMAEEINFPLGVYHACMNLNSIAWHNGQYIQRVDLINETLKIAEEIKRIDLVIGSKLALASIYRDFGFKAKERALYLEAHSMALQAKNKKFLKHTLRNIAMQYADDGNYELAIKYYLQTLNNEDQGTENFTILNSNIALNYARIGNYDSAIFYHERAIKFYESLFKKSGKAANMAYLLTMEGETYVRFNDFEHALACFNRAIRWHNERNHNPRIYALCLLNISEILIKRERNNEVNIQVLYGRIKNNLEQAIEIFKAAEKYPNLLRAYEAMKEINERSGNYKIANEYLKEMLITKDTLNNREQKAKLGELMIQYQLKENEQQVIQLQKEKSTNKLLILLLTGSLVLVIFSIVLFVSRQRLRYRNEKRELELSALRSQMNPHFIYNCLSSISLYIIQSEVGQATDYLTKFAKLMRSILDNSKHSFVSLTDEIKTLSLYIDLEAIRFNSKFSYKINVGEGVETESMMLSPMIIQPFVENAIWHGLQHKVEPGHIQIGFTIKNKALLCTVQDNGVGRKKTSELHGKSSMLKKTKSHGIQITKERLNLLSRKGLKTSLEIIDLMDDDNNPVGTKVEIELPIQRLS